MNTKNLMRWILLVPIVLLLLIILPIVLKFLYLVIGDNFAVYWITVLAYYILHPAIIVGIGARIAPSNKSLIIIILSLCLVVLYCMSIYLAYNGDEHFLTFVSYGLSLLGVFIVLIGRKVILDEV